MLTELYSSYLDMYNSVCCGPYLLGPSSASSRKPAGRMTTFCKYDRSSCAPNWLDDRTLVLSLQGLKITCTNDDVPFASLPSHLVNSKDSPLGVLRVERAMLFVAISHGEQQGCFLAVFVTYVLLHRMENMLVCGKICHVLCTELVQVSTTCTSNCTLAST